MDKATDNEGKLSQRNLYWIKLRHVYPRFLFVMLVTAMGALLLKWFTLKTDVPFLRQEMVDVYLPLFLPWLTILVWLRPSLRLLKFEKDNERGRFFLMFLAWLPVAVILLVMNSWLDDVASERIELRRIEEIGEARARYLALDSIAIDRRYGSMHVDVRSVGRGHEIAFTCFMVYPIDSSLEMNSLEYWYGVKFSRKVRRSLSDDERSDSYQGFLDKCVSDFEGYDFAQHREFELLPPSQDRDGFLTAVSRVAPDLTNAVVLTPRTHPSIKDANDKLAWISGIAIAGSFLIFVALFFPNVDKKEVHRRRSKSAKAAKGEAQFLTLLIPRPPHLATSLLIDLNVLVFLLMVFSGVDLLNPAVGKLLDWGGNRRFDTLGGEYWRLLTSMFVHGGLMHLFANIYGLVIAALLIEPLLGWQRLLFLYLVSGVLASLASVGWHENVVAVGASGAIFGLYGALGVMLIKGVWPEGERKVIVSLTAPFVVLSLLMGMLPGIDNAAHIGGLVAGALLGLLLPLRAEIVSEA